MIYIHSGQAMKKDQFSSKISQQNDYVSISILRPCNFLIVRRLREVPAPPKHPFFSYQVLNDPWPSLPSPPDACQKCTGQKCTKHQLVLLTIFNVLGPKKANNSWNSPQIDHRLLLVHSWLSGTKIWRRLIMVKSAKSTSSCFCFLSMLYVPYGIFEVLRGSK